MAQNASTNGASIAAGDGVSDADSMKGWVVEQQTTADMTTAMRRARITKPTPKPTEVLVRMKCAGLNPIDFKRATFEHCEHPGVPGVDGAGVIEDLGAGVEAMTPEGVAPLRVGDRVMFIADPTRKFGTFADFCVMEADTVSRIPDNVADATAAAVPCAAWTAYVALFLKLKVEAGRVLFVSGAAGGVGSYVVQMAKRTGVYVIGTASTYNIEYLRTLGVDVAIDYTQEDVKERVMLATKGTGVDYVVELVSPEHGLENAQLLRFGGAVCQVASKTLKGDDSFFRRQISVHHVFLAGFHQDAMTRPMLRQIGDVVGQMLSQGQISIPALEHIKFDQIPSALDQLKKRHARGKIVASIEEKAKGPQQQSTAAADATPAAESQAATSSESVPAPESTPGAPAQP